jgi:hypothetical protein
MDGNHTQKKGQYRVCLQNILHKNLKDKENKPKKKIYIYILAKTNWKYQDNDTFVSVVEVERRDNNRYQKYTDFLL